MLTIRDGENLEISVEDEKIILKKYYYMKNLEELGSKLIDLYITVSANNMIITDREKVVSSGLNQNFKNKKIPKKLVNIIDQREILKINSSLDFENVEIEGYIICIPIINDTDCIGLVIIFNKKDKIIEEEINTAMLISKILSEKLNIS